jgi:hypothetical protein
MENKLSHGLKPTNPFCWSLHYISNYIGANAKYKIDFMQAMRHFMSGFFLIFSFLNY